MRVDVPDFDHFVTLFAGLQHNAFVNVMKVQLVTLWICKRFILQVTKLTLMFLVEFAVAVLL